MTRRSILHDDQGNLVMNDALEFTPELIERARQNAALDEAEAAAKKKPAPKKKQAA